jgi:hypothetical protein
MSTPPASKYAHLCVQFGGGVGTPGCGKRMNVAVPNHSEHTCLHRNREESDRRKSERDQGEA